jgi:uncharacterized membrane protein (UPF0127 family)
LKVLVRNQTRKTVLGACVDVADTSAKRRTGLLKHTGLAPGEGLWIVPCESVHTFFMKFAIDLIYLDRDHKVRKVRIELPAGTAEETGTRPGDVLAIDPLP